MTSSAAPRWLERRGLEHLLDLLAERCARVLGPVVQDGAVVLSDVRRVDDLPGGWRDVQEPGRYRIEPGDGERMFDVVHGPESLKRLVFAPREPLVRIELQEGGGFRGEATLPEPERVAVIGVRACDLAGLAVQDRVFLYDRYPDPYYATRRRGLLLVAVSCTRSVSTCFCTSFGTGPEATSGYDLALAELDDGFTVRAGSPAGEDLLAALALPEADAMLCVDERRALDACAAGIDRRLETRDLPDLLYDNLGSPRWREVAERCLSCGNCTAVCPTCFCHDERDEPWLDGNGSLRVREWDSCFDPAHARVHGLDFRARTQDRYRQWLVHKLASWNDQFGTSGCVGCGRCIAWCPVGIDLTEEVAAIREGAALGGTPGAAP